MFRELTRLIEAATELASHATAGRAGVVDLRTRINTLGADARRAVVTRETREPMVDVFDEDDHYVIVAELRGVARGDLTWHVRDARAVVIRETSQRRAYLREIELASAVDAQTAVSAYDNGILELRVRKQS